MHLLWLAPSRTGLIIVSKNVIEKRYGAKFNETKSNFRRLTAYLVFYSHQKQTKYIRTWHQISNAVKSIFIADDFEVSLKSRFNKSGYSLASDAERSPWKWELNKVQTRRSETRSVVRSRNVK